MAYKYVGTHDCVLCTAQNMVENMISAGICISIPAEKSMKATAINSNIYVIAVDRSCWLRNYI